MTYLIGPDAPTQYITPHCGRNQPSSMRLSMKVIAMCAGLLMGAVPQVEGVGNVTYLVSPHSANYGSESMLFWS